MEITGISVSDFEMIVDDVAKKYGGNIYTDVRDVNTRATRIRGRVHINDSRGPGARVSGSGRRMPAACWHVYRDVIAGVFEYNPYAVVRTGVATYRGCGHFRDTFEDTAMHNVGSLARPVCIADACRCEYDSDEDYDAFIQKLKHRGPYGMAGI